MPGCVARQSARGREAYTTFAAIFLLALPLFAQPDPARQLEAAIHREIVDGDLPAARDAYRAITADASTPRPVAARALLQLGACQEKLGQRREAHATYARIVREFAAETEIAGQARTRLAGWTDAPPGPRNLRFEEGDPGKMPPGWFVPAVEASLGELHRKGCRTEGGCAAVVAPPNAPGQVGNLMQSFSATAYRGKTVRLRGWVRVEAGAPNDRAQMFLHVFLPNGRPGFSDHMDDRPVRSAEWTQCEIVGEIDRDAQFLQFGVTAIGRGRVWVDDVTFDIVPEEQVTAARNAIRRQYSGDTAITAFRFSGAEAVATVRTASIREGFAYVETFRDTWMRTGDGWKATQHAPLASYFEAPDADPETVRAVAADLRQHAIALNGIGPPVSADCFAVHRAETPAGAAETVLAAAGLRTFFFDVTRASADSALGRWLAEPHLFSGRPVTLTRSCKGIVFVEAGGAEARP